MKSHGERVERLSKEEKEKLPSRVMATNDLDRQEKFCPVQLEDRLKRPSLTEEPCR